MSHNVEIKDIKINDQRLLEQAVEELRKEGHRISIEYGAKIRAYTPQFEVNCDIVIRLEDSKYDVGLNKQPDGTYSAIGEGGIGVEHAGGVRATSGKFGSYWPGNYGTSAVGAEPGSQTVSGEACEVMGPAAAIGRVLQRYNVVVAEYEAARAGYSTTRETDRKTGQMVVVAEVM